MQSRAPDVDELMRYPFAFTLLTQIARRARRTVDGFNPHGLRPGEALIGDHSSIGASQQNYRTAKKCLDEWGFATFRATNKGTVARLRDTRVYDINIESFNEQGDKQTNNPTTSQPPCPATTNEEDKEGDKELEDRARRDRELEARVGSDCKEDDVDKEFSNY